MKKVFLIIAGLQLTSAIVLSNINLANKQNESVKYHQIYVLGDSLSDNGALVGAWSALTSPILGYDLVMDDPFYQNHSFSNGRVAAEVLANKLNFNLDAAWNFDFLFKTYNHVGNNYAIGGAQSAPLKWTNPRGIFFNNFTINRQIDALLEQHTLQNDDLTFFQVGSNDFWFQILTAPANEQEELMQISVASQGKALQRLVDNGNKHILTMNTPDVSKTPWFRGTDKEEGIAKITGRYNDLWMNMIANLQAKYPHYFKVFDIYNELPILLADFAAKGGNTEQGAVDISLDWGSLFSGHVTPVYNEGVTFETINDHFFFDFVHPTEVIHENIGEMLYQLATSKW